MRAYQEAGVGILKSSSMACIALLALLAIALELSPLASGVLLLQRARSGGTQSLITSKTYVRSSSLISESPVRMPVQRSLSLPSPSTQMSPMPFSAVSSVRSRSLKSQSSFSSLFGGKSDLFNLIDVFSPDSALNANGNDIGGSDQDYDSDSGSTPRHGPQVGGDFSGDMLFPEEKVISDFRKSSFRVRNSLEERYHIPSGPVVVAPGYGGSRLEARLSEPGRSRHSCGRKYGWFGVWINLGLLFNIDCMVYAMKLNFNPMTNTTHDSPGIEVRVQKDKIDKVEALHSLPMSEFSYFGPIIKRLISSLGYTREINIRGAPYDFRKAPDELHKYYYNLRKTIEQLYTSNGNKRVSLICHSMGCPVMLYFLQRMQQVWKNIYIQRLISLAAPWAGSMGAVRATFFGDNLGAPLLFEESKMNQLQRSLPATMFLFPKEYLYKNRTLIRTNTDPILHIAPAPAMNYTLNDMEQLFKLAGHDDGYKMYLNTKNLLGDLDPPNVEVWCLVGKGFKTLSQYNFAASFPHSPREELYEDGDRTVSLESASHCRSWTSKQTQLVHYKEFAAVDHMGILRDQGVLNYIERILDVDLINEVIETN